MRVAQVLPAYFDERLDFMGGGDRYVFCLARALQQYCDVTFFTFGSKYREAKIGAVSHVTLPVGPFGNADNPFPASLAFASPQFDVVHVYHLRSTVTSLAILLRRARGKNLVVTDLGGGGRSLTRRLRLYRLVSAFTTISEFSRTLLPGSVRDRAVVIRGGIDVGRFSFHPGPRTRQVLQVSRIMPHKGQNYLIEAAGSDIPVVIAGKVVNQGYYRDLIEMARGKQVRFMIDPDDDAVRAEYRRSAVTVAASVYRDMYGGYWPTSELLGLPLLESMSTGTPVICTRVGGMPEYVVDGQTGYVVPPNDPATLRQRLLELLDDPSTASRMGAAGHEHVRQYDWDVVAKRVMAEYRRLPG